VKPWGCKRTEASLSDYRKKALLVVSAGLDIASEKQHPLHPAAFSSCSAA